MSLDIPKRYNIEDFVIENNVIKGVNHNFDLSRSIGERLLDALNRKPQHVGQIEVETGSHSTFADMKDRSVRCGIWLKQQGISSNDIVVICSKANSKVYAPMFGTLYVGGTFAGWNPFTVALKPVQHYMKLFKPKIVFADEDIIETLQEAAKLENIDTKFVVFGKHPNYKSLDDIIKLSTNEDVHSFRPEKVNPKNNAVIVLTSGSTGLSKGVVHSYENTLKFVCGFNPDKFDGVVMWYSTCDWITGVGYTMLSVLLSATRIVHAQFEAEETCRIIEKYKVNRILLSHIAMGHMVKLNVFKKYNLQSLKYVCTGGSKVSTQILKTFRDALPNALVVQLYGMSELGRAITSQTKNTKNLDSAGLMTVCSQLKVKDINTKKSLSANQPGEICIKSDIMMTGYYNNPEATKEILDDEGWLHTGDKGYYDENGEVTILERIKEMMKYRGYQISPSEVEEVLLSHPGVMEVSVVSLPHPEDIDRPMAFVKKAPGSQVTEEELVNLSASVLGNLRKLHGGVKFIDNLPKTGSGKINRPLLKAKAKELACKQ